jgi:hypothetical protein
MFVHCKCSYPNIIKHDYCECVDYGTVTMTFMLYQSKKMDKCISVIVYLNTAQKEYGDTG